RSQETCRQELSPATASDGAYRCRVFCRGFPDVDHPLAGGRSQPMSCLVILVPDRSSVSRLTSPADRRSACPGLFRLAPALDGAICRVKLAGGRLSAEQARAIAAAVATVSAAPLELTNRGNFQIRAIQPQHELPLIEALVAAGLGPQPALGDKIPGGKAGGKVAAAC